MTSYDITVSCGISLVNFVLKKFNNCIHTKPILKTYSFSSTINRRVSETYTSGAHCAPTTQTFGSFKIKRKNTAPLEGCPKKIFGSPSAQRREDMMSHQLVHSDDIPRARQGSWMQATKPILKMQSVSNGVSESVTYTSVPECGVC